MLLVGEVDGVVHLLPNVGHKDPYRQAKAKKLISELLNNEKFVIVFANTLQEAVSNFDTAIFINSAYDIDISDMYFDCYRLGVKLIYNHLIASLATLKEVKGILPALCMSFEICLGH